MTGASPQCAECAPSPNASRKGRASPTMQVRLLPLPLREGVWGEG